MAVEPLFNQMSDSKNPSFIKFNYTDQDYWGYYVDLDTGNQSLRQYIDGKETGTQIQIDTFGSDYEGGRGIKIKLPVSGSDDGFVYTPYVGETEEDVSFGIAEVRTDIGMPKR